MIFEQPKLTPERIRFLTTIKIISEDNDDQGCCMHLQPCRSDCMAARELSVGERHALMNEMPGISLKPTDFYCGMLQQPPF